MFPSAGTERTVKPSGLLIALLAFVLTRVTVAEALVVGSGPVTAVASLIPLVVGLALAAFGVSLAVSTYDHAFVNTVTVWFLLGVAGMFLVVVLALLAQVDGGLSLEARTSALVANVLIGGGAAGTLVGLHSASARRHRQALARRNEQAVLLNRLLRHEVLNALTVVDGHTELLASGDGGRPGAVRENVDRIQAAIDEVGFLVRTGDETGRLGPVPLDAALDRAVETLRTGSDVPITVDDRLSGEVLVRGDDHLDRVVTALCSHALEFGTVESLALTARADDDWAHLHLTAAGEWLTPGARAALTDGLPEFDDPTVGYGIPIARLLVDQYGGRIRVEDGGVTVSLPRTTSAARPSDEHGVGAAALRDVTVAALASGVVMGITIHLLSGSLPVIGALYGVDTLTVGWITHLFHSVVFGIVFAGALSRPRLQAYTTAPLRAALMGVGYGTLLWLVAAGVVMSLWLNAVGIPAPLPSLSLGGLFGHVLWGGVLGGTFALLRQ